MFGLFCVGIDEMCVIVVVYCVGVELVGFSVLYFVVLL